MTTNEAQKAGVKAYQQGRQNAPALNQKFLVAACASETSTVDLMKAYTYGWTIAHLADGATDPMMPSVKELVRICA